MKQNYAPEYTVLFLVLMTLVIAPGCEKQGEETVQAGAPDLAARKIELEGQSNFRDIGGYRTSDGRTVKTGMVYRSGDLNRLTDADVKILADLGIKTVANFLTTEEIEAHGADRLPGGVREIPLPIESGNAEELTRIANEARATGDFSLLPPDMNPEIHRMLVDEGREEYAALLRELAEPQSCPAVFHCSHGVHRTGTATAILLSLLGVPWETVREDYLLSNDARAEQIGKRLEALRQSAAKTLGIPADEVDMTNIRAFYILEGEYIDASHREIVDRYGSVENYTKEALGLSEKEIEQIRANLLE